jgi:hypothetical protein
MTPKD